METNKNALSLLVKTAVAEALESQGSPSPTSLECPGCGTKLAGVPAYLDHRVGEYVGSALEELKKTVAEIKVPTSQEFLEECKGGLCTIIEEVYDVTKKGVAPEITEPEEPDLLHDYNEPVEEPEK